MSESKVSVVARVGSLLRFVAEREPQGVTTTDAGRGAGLPRASAHRLLSTLEREGLVERVEAGRWVLGPEAYLLGQAAAPRFDVTDSARKIVAQLAEQSGESAFLSARRGDQTVCLLREDGSFPLRSHVLHEGIRFPLGVASAGLAVLSHLNDREADDYLERVDLAPIWGPEHGTAEIRRRMEATRETGYAVNPGLIVEGSWGIGSVVFDGLGRPGWALSLTGVESRFRGDRLAWLGSLLLTRAHQLTKALGARPGPA